MGNFPDILSIDKPITYIGTTKSPSILISYLYILLSMMFLYSTLKYTLGKSYWSYARYCMLSVDEFIDLNTLVCSCT